MDFRALARVASLMLASVLLPASAWANTLTANITYYAISSADPDANHLCCSGPLPEVLNTLGPNGLPLLIPGFTSGGHAPQDVNAFGELTYWSHAFNPYVTQGLSSTVGLPFSNSNMYNPNGMGGSDGGSNGYLAAIISATLTAPVSETISFTVSSDDNAFVYLDGQLVCNDGGVHGPGAVPCSTLSNVAAGDHSLQIFYDDLNQTGAVLDFTIDTTNVSTTPPVVSNGVPEPSALLLAGIALAGLGWATRSARRQSR
jgi:hypothetical protein